MEIPKGWKKYDECDRPDVAYIHLGWKKGTRINLSINRGNVLGDWAVTHFPESNKIKHFSKTFKRKSFALKFAEKFMKNKPHPN